MNTEKAIETMKYNKHLLGMPEQGTRWSANANTIACDLAISALEKEIPKKVYHFLEDDTFETDCCGIDVTNQDYNYCPMCGQLLGKVEVVEVENE